MKIRANKPAENLIFSGIEALDELNFTQKLYKHDGTLWKQDAQSVKFIESYLGWTEVYDWTLPQLPEIKTFAAQVKPLFNHVVLMGMGGSSLAPEVLRVLFGKQPGWPELLVLDSTNPDWVASVRNQIDPLKTLFIFASKSGGTVEPASQFAYFYEELSKQTKTPGDNFIAITDPGTGLEELAAVKRFRKIFTNPADIGGRFSALSLFGAVPAALCGYDVDAFIKLAKAEGEIFKAEKDSAAAKLGAFLGRAYLEGKDKIALIMPKNIAALGLWIEQLVAESTGKEGKGIVPIAGEALHKGFDYKDDRVFVSVTDAFAASGKDVEEAIAALRKSNYPLFEIEMDTLKAIGAQFLLWEVATAAAGALLEINPFDQPNVQLSKTITKGLLADLEAGKKSPETTAPFIVSKNLQGKVSLNNLAADIYKLAQGKDYIALLPYVYASPGIDAQFAVLRDKIFTGSKHSVLFGYGPRYLHSTGQLHKGDGNNGIFIVISADAETDVEIPGALYSFSDLANAQALADFKALEEKGRRAIKLHLTKPVLEALKELSAKF